MNRQKTMTTKMEREGGNNNQERKHARTKLLSRWKGKGDREGKINPRFGQTQGGVISRNVKI